jgi:hypothetical protein
MRYTIYPDDIHQAATEDHCKKPNNKYTEAKFTD